VLKPNGICGFGSGGRHRFRERCPDGRGFSMSYGILSDGILAFAGRCGRALPIRTAEGPETGYYGVPARPFRRRFPPK